MNIPQSNTNGQQAFQTALKMTVLTGQGFQIKTSPATALFQAVLLWLQCGNLGGMVYGRSRLGKTSAIRWVCKQLSEMFNFIRFIEFPIRTQSTYSEAGFFDYLIQCCDLKEVPMGRASAKRRNSLNQYLLAQANRSPLRMVILVVDEAQDIANIYLKWIQNIANELETKGVKLFVLLVGQPELNELKTKTVAIGAEHFVGRYMVCSHAFEGIRSESQLSEVLAAYDSTVFPPKGKSNPEGKKFKNHFIPTAVADSFELRDLAGSFWAAFTNVWTSQKPGGQMEIPMHYIASSLMFCMEGISRLPAGADGAPPELIETSVNSSGFRESVEISAIRLQREASRSAKGDK